MSSPPSALLGTSGFKEGECGQRAGPRQARSQEYPGGIHSFLPKRPEREDLERVELLEPP
jgi:hypothetical protein